MASGYGRGDVAGGRRAAAGPAAAGATGAGARRGTRACAERHPDVRAGDAAS